MHICILNNNVNSKVNVINITSFLLLFLTSYLFSFCHFFVYTDALGTLHAKIYSMLIYQNIFLYKYAYMYIK